MHPAIAITIPLAAACLLASLAGFFLLRRRSMLRPDTEKGATIAQFLHGPKNGSDNSPPTPKDDIVASSPRRFTWPEVESATANFTSDVIGKGGFSTVYFARLKDSTTASVKLHQSSERLHRAFRLELDILLRLHHPHIVRLLGYCDEQDDQGVLIFEFIPNGSLHEKLHSGSVLPWARRTSIAYRLAQALDYLHEGCELQIVHGDIKASNVLLDGDLSPKLCDFGCACMGFSSAVRPPASMTGSPGYIDPNYIRTGMVSKKSDDVYSFGVVLLLVMITGAEAFDARTERVLAAEVGKVLRQADSGYVSQIADRRLAGEYDEGEVQVMAAISALCIGENPSLRPSMADVVRMMEDKVPSAITAVEIVKRE
ncbi:LOW QUALITY PROTEIN: probable receptor-like protein kinase At1g33260 [Phalaenopsis equestris]|uniref:LOW QUALITY PROTEIN: probable receptor-like protein kinase At1g33260 n=1 Tax=Phalaenopsis equestris TaxID=78828 RepID=UPI0009E633B4|nr:LOW QUALITY PROTEIN: probable receptor-like protein kinase At1g33260 [Phalaenopsis equestris]